MIHTDTVRGKVYVVDTSVLVSAPDALSHLTDGNTVIIPFPVLQELDRRRTSTNGVGYTARQTIRFLDQLQSDASTDQLRDGIPLRGGVVRFHGGALDVSRAWPGFSAGYADDAIILMASAYRDANPDAPVVLITRDAAMRCKARDGGCTPKTITPIGRSRHRTSFIQAGSESTCRRTAPDC